MEHSLVGWQLGRFDDVDWSPWGSGGNARAKVLADADGFFLALVEADPGYSGDAHEHAHAEFLYVIDGTIRTQGTELKPGDAYGASPGSTHTDFVTERGATYVSIFKI